MEAHLIYYSDIKDGKIQNNVRQKIANELHYFNNKRVEIRIEKLKSTRSMQQNRYWWVAVTILANELGYDKNEMHEICKMKFLKLEKVCEKTGEIFEYVGSTTKLSKSEFADMVNDFVRWAADTFNVIIPLPNEQLDIEL